jgi:F-box-like
MIRIDVLPDDVLLEIFDFYMVPSGGYSKTTIEAWQSLIHVCRRWRYLIFGSPRRLNLRLYCTPFTPTRDKLDVWPALPLVVASGDTGLPSSCTDNIIAALEQSNRVCDASLESLEDWQLEEVLAAMQVPFPELTFLQLSPDHETSSVIPDSFLGGSAPRLRYFDLDGIPFPGLPNLLLSATQLVTHYLSNIPDSGYISPEAMVALLSVLSSLERLSLRFEYLQSRPVSESRSLPPIKRAILPALSSLYFKGVSAYLEEIVTHIDAPQLDVMGITLFNQISTPRLAQFINRTPILRAGDKARVGFYNWHASVELLARVRILYILISCREPDRQLSSVAQVFNPLHSLSTVERLYIGSRNSQLVWNNIQNTLWLQLLLPFSAVKNLYVSKGFAPSIVAALKEPVGRLGGKIQEVLLSLQNIFVEALEPSGPLQENIGQFVAARQLSDHPVAISDWDRLDVMQSVSYGPCSSLEGN